MVVLPLRRLRPRRSSVATLVLLLLCFWCHVTTGQDSSITTTASPAGALPSELDALLSRLAADADVTTTTTDDDDARLDALREKYRAHLAHVQGRIEALTHKTHKIERAERASSERLEDLLERTAALDVSEHNRRELTVRLKVRLEESVGADDKEEDDDDEDEEQENGEETRENSEDSEAEADYVTKDDMHSTMEDLLLDSQPWEQELEQHVTAVTAHAIHQRLVRPYGNLTVGAIPGRTAHHQDPTPSCLSPHRLHDLARQADGRTTTKNDDDTDYSLRARIVHHDPAFTSPTYDRPTSEGRLPLRWSSLLGRTQARILQPDTALGSCWPAALTPHTEAYVTLAFPHPIYVSSVAIHHDGGSRNSAPRSFRVEGFGDCADHDVDCVVSPGFNADDRFVVLHDAEYDVDRQGVVQHFLVGSGVVRDDVRGEEEEEEEEEDLDNEEEESGGAGMCSMPPPSENGEESTPDCGGDVDLAATTRDRPVKAVRLVIESNWGNNKDYTCLYRLQVFGREVSSVDRDGGRPSEMADSPDGSVAGGTTGGGQLFEDAVSPGVVLGRSSDEL